MKKLLPILLLFLIGCSNPHKEKLIGKWGYVSATPNEYHTDKEDIYIQFLDKMMFFNYDNTLLPYELDGDEIWAKNETTDGWKVATILELDDTNLKLQFSCINNYIIYGGGPIFKFKKN